MAPTVLDALSAAKNPNQTVYVDLGEGKVPMRFRHAPGAKALIVCFHGAVDRATREIPAFAPYLLGQDNSAHQLLISDPAMLLDGTHRLGWYAGYDGFNLQAVLGQAIRKVAAELGVERVVYFGTSGGGLAALYYGWYHPGSVVVVGNPQTDIERYYKSLIDLYRAACWPKLATDAALGSVIAAEVNSLYSRSIENTVVYLQETTDRFHLHQHLAPFLAAIPPGIAARSDCL